MRLADDKVKAIKAATSQLIHEVGGAEVAAMVCRASQPVLYEYMSPNRLDRVIAVDVALQLEAHLGKPIVTGAMARMQGLAIARPDAAAAPAIGAAVGTAVAQAGALASALLAAQADGRLDAGERAALLTLAEAVRNAADETMAGLAPGGAALRVVA